MAGHFNEAPVLVCYADTGRAVRTRTGRVNPRSEGTTIRWLNRCGWKVRGRIVYVIDWPQPHLLGLI